MKTPYHLSNYEVLTHFLELKRDNDELQSLQKRHKERQELILKQQYPIPEDDYDDGDFDAKRGKKGKKTKPEVVIPVVSDEEKRKEQIAVRRGTSEELPWVTDSVINYLCGDLCQTSRQSPEGIESLIHGLQARGLVKAEVLQITNLLPADSAELYCVIEDTEARFGLEAHAFLDEIRDEVASSLLPEAPSELEPFVQAARSDGFGTGLSAAHYEEQEDYEDQDEMEQFVHEAEWGAGKEVGVGDEEEEME